MVRTELNVSRTLAQYPNLQSNTVKNFPLERVSRMSKLFGVKYFGMQFYIFKGHGSKQILRVLSALTMYTRLWHHSVASVTFVITSTSHILLSSFSSSSLRDYGMFLVGRCISFVSGLSSILYSPGSLPIPSNGRVSIFIRSDFLSMVLCPSGRCFPYLWASFL